MSRCSPLLYLRKTGTDNLCIRRRNRTDVNLFSSSSHCAARPAMANSQSLFNLLMFCPGRFPESYGWVVCVSKSLAAKFQTEDVWRPPPSPWIQRFGRVHHPSWWCIVSFSLLGYQTGESGVSGAKLVIIGAKLVEFRDNCRKITLLSRGNCITSSTLCSLTYIYISPWSIFQNCH